MESFWIDLGISVAITLLRKLAGNKEQAGAWRKAFLKIHTLIWGVYGDDPAFRIVVGLPIEGE